MFENVRIKYCCLKLNWITHFLVETNSLENNNKNQISQINILLAKKEENILNWKKTQHGW